MTVQIVRGQVGRENVWSIGQEGGFIAYLRGNIGDLPVRSEALAFADGRTLDDSYGLVEAALSAFGRVGDDSATYSESTIITNS